VKVAAALKYKRPLIPLSEDEGKQNYSASAQNCIDDLMRLAEKDPKKVLSRNYYRLNGKYAESVWNRFFGTFEEFKRQAGIKLTRQQHLLEKQIAKQASVDHYRALNAERAGYADKYTRKDKKRWKLAIILCDVHDKEADPFLVRVVTDIAKRTQPDLFCFGGDLFDLPEFGKYGVDPRLWEPVKRIEAAKKIVGGIREASPDSQIDLIEGNHEFRLLRHMADATPALQEVLSKLHGFTIPKLLGLDEFQVNYIAKGDLAAYTSKDISTELSRNYRVYWDSFMVNHFPKGRNMGVPGVNGHHHKLISWPMTSAIYGAYNWYQIGAGHRRSATYCDGEDWSNGFMLAHVDTERRATCFEYVDVRDFACVGGKYYYRQEGEI
jgi:hypothetical protein